MIKDEVFELQLSPRETEEVSLRIPGETLASIRRVAAKRGMSPEALLKLYVGQGLRQDLSREFGDRVMATAARVLTRHIKSEDEVSEIIRSVPP
jgi:hypothetical protein